MGDRNHVTWVTQPIALNLAYIIHSTFSALPLFLWFRCLPLQIIDRIIIACCTFRLPRGVAECGQSFVLHDYELALIEKVYKSRNGSIAKLLTCFGSEMSPGVPSVAAAVWLMACALFSPIPVPADCECKALGF